MTRRDSRGTGLPEAPIRIIVIQRMLAVGGMLVLAALMVPPTPAAAIVPDSPCNEKCLADYNGEGVKCGKIEDEGARKTCQNDS